MERVRQRRWWLLGIIIVAIGSVWLARTWLFADASCPRLQELLLYLAAGVGIGISLLYALATRGNALVKQVSLLFILAAWILFASSFGGVILGLRSEVQLVFCPPDTCDTVALARNFRETGRLDGAEDVARNCVYKNINPVDTGCVAACGRELALALYDKAGQDLDVVDLSSEWTSVELDHCDLAETRLVEALISARDHGHPDIVRSIEERRRRVSQLCTGPTRTPSPTSIPTATPSPPPTYTPTPTATSTPIISVEIIRAEHTSSRALVDVRVVDRISNDSIHRLNPADFILSSDGQADIPFVLEERDADDPICLIAVVDDSGSIRPGIEQIGAALTKLNERRKPGDELGMVLFAERDQVRIVQLPGGDPLDVDPVLGRGDLTALWDGVLAGLEAATSCTVDSVHLLVLTDGTDNDSVHLEGDNPTKARTVANMAVQQGVDICTVGVSSDQLDEESLQLAQTGCGYYPAANFDVLGSKLIELFGFVRDYYRLTLPPSAIPDERRITLEVLRALEIPVDFPGE